MQMETEALFDAAFTEHQAGNLAEAQRLYQQVLQSQPLHADALHLQGVLTYQLGRLDLAEELIQRAIRVKPTAGYFGNLGLVAAAAGRNGAAIVAYRQAIELHPDFAEAHNNLANILRLTGRISEAITAYRRAIACRPDFAEAHNNLGLCLVDAGQIDEAIASYRQAVELHPNAAETRNNLAIVLGQKGEWQKAIDCWREAISFRADYAEAYNNLANAYKQTGRLDDAIATFKTALELQPNLPQAHNNLGVIYFDRGQVSDAIAAYRAALVCRGDFADAHYNLAIALHQAGDLPQAIAGCRRAIVCRAAWPQAYNNLGIWLGESSRQDDAIAAFDAAITANPAYAEAYNNRGNVHRQAGKLNEAIADYQRAISIRPDHAEAWNNLGVSYKQLGRLEEAASAFRRAMTLAPELAEAHNNLGNVLKDQGDLDAALACYERAITLRPEDAAADSNRIYTLYFHPAYSAEMILAEHQRWNHRHAASLQSLILPHENDASLDRRLRIGYVAPDFREHCQSLFTVPLLSHHDHENFEIYCYADVAAPDAMTDQLREYADVWRNIIGQSDHRVAEMIRHDQIDILVDLTVHMSHNRLAVFARKPAPIQVTWLGYPGTTGLETIDYRLSDPYLDPPDHDAFYSEQTVRLPDSFWCYDPLTEDLAVNHLPALSNGYITFGCLNNFCKINDAVLRLWAQVLRRMPNSRLLLLAPEGIARKRVIDVLADEQIDRARIEFSSRLSRRRYLELYHRIDLGLDTFPYNGHTTSLDSIWMGVPVVTRVGQTAVGRAGYAQLSNLGLTDLAANSGAEFVETALALAQDTQHLAELRGMLRDHLEQSPLMDAEQFAQNVEAAFRGMWESQVLPRETAPDRGEGVTVYVTEAAKRHPTRVRQAS